MLFKRFAPPDDDDREFTVVESRETRRALVVRRVSPDERKVVWRWGGFLFATAAEAERFAEAQMIFADDGPPVPRQVFSHKRIDGQRIYVRLPRTM